MFRHILLLLALFLCSCTDSNEEGKIASFPIIKSGELETKKAKPSRPAPSLPAEDVENLPEPEERNHADAVLDFVNRSLEVLASGKYSQANALHANSRLYLKTWHLAPRPPRSGSRELTVPAGLFDSSSTEELKKLATKIDQSLNKLMAAYTSLERYVADTSIMDEGRRGKELVANIDKAHASFIKSRQSWLEIVQKQALQAEATLLKAHPLQRQIMDSQQIFGQFREVANLLASGSVNRELLRAVYVNIATLRADAAKPPFPASPALERGFRQFLKQVEQYQVVFDRGITEGFHSLQRRELNNASLECQKAYNEFAALANRSQN